MKQEDKELLLQDISARLSYKVMCFVEGKDKVYKLKGIIKHRGLWWFEFDGFRSVEAKPYLRPMSSMTEEEDDEWWKFANEPYVVNEHTSSLDWLNAHHFDYRGLIEKGLAIAVTKENNPYKE